MNPNQERKEALFEAARHLTSPAERAAYLDQACGNDLELRQQVEAMLESESAADLYFGSADVPGEALREVALNSSTATTKPLAEGPGTVVGRYKLLQQIGEGGFGVVYMAEQQEPVRRKIALKVIKLGMDTRQVVARFEAERQALALMDHPHVAKVLDAGATDEGRPFFVMELVHGIPINAYCDQRNLSPIERLKLFLPVCQAIQHAHQKGIIHRDIKPSNVLVTLNDGVPHPMVIDFGVAKALNQRLTEKTLFTEFGQMIGTPAYMSPEQAEMSKPDVDTRSDIYSLGVLLYELLTGTPPFSEQRLRSAGWMEMQRIIAEEDPPRPSTRLSALTEPERTGVAQHRRTEAPKLIHLVRGELDWIVMKCLEKDRARRYETANGLAMDVQRYLNDEPVSAAAPSARYRVMKFVRRNKAMVTAGVTVAAALVLGIVGSTWQAVRATRAELEQTQLRQQAETSERKAQIAVRRSQHTDRSMLSLLDDVVSAFRWKDKWLLTEVLDAALSNATQVLHEEPAAVADVYERIGLLYYRIDQNARAENTLRESLRLRQADASVSPAQLAKVHQTLGHLLETQHRWEDANRHFQEALTLHRSLNAGSTKDSVKDTLLGLMTAQNQLGQHGAADATLRQLLDLMRRQGDLSTFVVHGAVRFWEVQGKLDDAEALWREGLSRFRTSQIPMLDYEIQQFADFLGRRAKFEEAGQLLTESLRLYQAAAGEQQNPDSTRALSLGESLIELAWAQRALLETARAAQAAEEAERLIRAYQCEVESQWAPFKSSLLGGALAARAAVGTSLPKTRRLAWLAEAEPLVLSGVQELECWVLGGTNDVGITLKQAQRLYAVWNELEPSSERFERAEQWRWRSIENADPVAPRNQANALERQGKLAEAEQLFREILGRERLVATNASPRLVGSLIRLADVLREQDKGREAEPLWVAALETIEQLQPPTPASRQALLEQLEDLFQLGGESAPRTSRGIEIAVDRLRKGFTQKQTQACIANLKQIKGAKDQWALERAKGPDDTCGPRDLWGMRGFIAAEPRCPAGGTYTIGPVKEPPRCSLHAQGHRL